MTGINPGLLATIPSQLPQQQKKNPLQQALDILGSKGGQTAVGAIGAGLGAYGASKSAEADRNLSAQQFGANMAQRQLENDQQLQLQRASAGAAASPLGQDQNFAARQALVKQLLGNARNVSVTPGDPAVAAAMGSVSGGMRLPESGFNPEMLEKLFGDQATMASLAQRAQNVGQINPHAAQFDMTTIFGDAAQPHMDATRNASQSLIDQQEAASSKQRELIQRAIDEDIRGEKQPKQGGGNIFGKILKGVGMGASFIPGVGQIVAPIATGLGGLVNGDGLKSSLINAGMSAIPGLAAGGKLGTDVAKFAKSGIGKAVLGGIR